MATTGPLGGNPLIEDGERWRWAIDLMLVLYPERLVDGSLVRHYRRLSEARTVDNMFALRCLYNISPFSGAPGDITAKDALSGRQLYITGELMHWATHLMLRLGVNHSDSFAVPEVEAPLQRIISSDTDGYEFLRLMRGLNHQDPAYGDVAQQGLHTIAANTPATDSTATVLSQLTRARGYVFNLDQVTATIVLKPNGLDTYQFHSGHTIHIVVVPDGNGLRRWNNALGMLQQFTSLDAAAVGYDYQIETAGALTLTREYDAPWSAARVTRLPHLRS